MSTRTPRALVIAGPGTNRDGAAARALRLAGADASTMLASALVEQPEALDACDVLAIAGGFSYADALGAGRLFAMQLMLGDGGRLGDALRAFAASGRPIIGICNGFQVLTQAGLLPGALGHNAASAPGSGHFDCRWVTLAAEAASRCVWTTGVTEVDCPIAHGEGRYVHDDPTALAAGGQVALRYVTTNGSTNPNGSIGDIAGVCDASGVVLGLMPHPEDHAIASQHPRTRRDATTVARLGLTIFQRGVAHARSL